MQSRTPPRDAGQGAIEYVAIILVVAVVLAAGIFALGSSPVVSGAVSSGYKKAVCTLTSQSCPSGSDQAGGNGNGNGGDGNGSGDGTGDGTGSTGPADNLQLAAYNKDGGADDQNSLGGQASRLPRGGNYPFVPKKGQNVDNPKSLSRNGGRFVDADGNEWQWDPVKGEWDVQNKVTGRGNKPPHTNIGEDGEITHGDDNFQKKPRPKGGQQQSDGGDGSDNKGPDVGKSVAVGGGVVAGGAALWWLAKLASPACGPFVVVCAIAF